jgi:hypothetical protein
MKIQFQGREVLGAGIPATVGQWLSLPGQADSAEQRLTPAEQLRQARLEGIRAASEENVAWLWLAASAAAVLAVSLWTWA